MLPSAIERGIRDGMQILRDRHCNLHRVRIALVSVGGDDHGPETAPSGTRVTTKPSELTTTGASKLAKLYFGAEQFLRAQPGAR